jgi:hypothetical protein
VTREGPRRRSRALRLSARRSEPTVPTTMPEGRVDQAGLPRGRARSALRARRRLSKRSAAKSRPGGWGFDPQRARGARKTQSRQRPTSPHVTTGSRPTSPSPGHHWPPTHLTRPGHHRQQPIPPSPGHHRPATHLTEPTSPPASDPPHRAQVTTGPRPTPPSPCHHRPTTHPTEPRSPPATDPPQSST